MMVGGRACARHPQGIHTGNGRSGNEEVYTERVAQGPAGRRTDLAAERSTRTGLQIE